MLSRNEVIQIVSNSTDLVSRVRVILGTICIEAKSASDVVAIDNALDVLSRNFNKILTEYPPENDCEKCSE